MHIIQEHYFAFYEMGEYQLNEKLDDLIHHPESDEKVEIYEDLDDFIFSENLQKPVSER